MPCGRMDCIVSDYCAAMTHSAPTAGVPAALLTSALRCCLLCLLSPGHRKNMLAHHNWCAIAVWKNPQGAYYSTQLFGLG